MTVRTPLKLLIAVPVTAYLLSYVYLAFYHGRFWIFSTIVHEGGRHSLTDTLFYSSHFLGHIPVLTMIAFLFTGAYLCLSPGGERAPEAKKTGTFTMLLIGFVAAAFMHSCAVFGPGETWMSIAQKTQGARHDAEGGYWNLHLASTLLLFPFMLVYISAARILFAREVRLHFEGWGYLLTAGLGVALLTVAFNRQPGTVLRLVWEDPRYLAHSVRELATFPVTYFPLSLYLLFRDGRGEGGQVVWQPPARNTVYLLASSSAFFLYGFSYQVRKSLEAGIGTLAQSPSFAKGGVLEIPYLLTSHYFEHFLDTVYFTLLVLLLHGFARSRSRAAR